MGPRLGRAAKVTVRRVVPLRMRKRMAIWLGRRKWQSSYYWTMELLRDLAEQDPNTFHRFLWANHLAYAETYEVERRLVPATLHPTREMLLTDLAECLECHAGIGNVGSVLDVGCSLGYLLRRLETGLFAGAQQVDGIDIDGYAIDRGSAYLKREGSRVRLAVADMSTVDQVFGTQAYDVVLSAGVLMYLREEDAQRVVTAMLMRTRHLLVLTGLAHPGIDNSELAESQVRERDGTFVHNLDAMITAAGGTVIQRRWEGPRQIEGNTIYFVFATPAGAGIADRRAAVASVGAAQNHNPLEQV